MSEFTMAFDLHNMVGAPAGRDVIQVMYKSEDGILSCYGITVPTDVNAFAPGCKFFKVNDTGGNVEYTNVGTFAAPNFQKIASAKLAGTAAGRGPSPAIWDDALVQETILDPTLGSYFFSEFESGPIAAATESSVLGIGGMNWIVSSTAGSVIAGSATEPTGVSRLTTSTIDEGAIITALQHGNVAGSFLPSRTWEFECRVRLNTITDSKFAAFIGFAEEGLLTVGALIANSTPWDMADKDFFGFQRINADGDALDTRHNTESGGGIDTIGADAVTLEVDTWVKVGAKCDGTTITFYADGVALADTVLLAATNFPDDQEMAFYIAHVAGANESSIIDIDWLRIHQLY